MADQQDQRSDPPADPTFIPLEKREMAAKSLHGSNEAPESKPEHDSESKPEHDSESSDSGDDKDLVDEFAEDFRKKKLEELKRKAFYSVLLAFRSESSTIRNKRTQIIEKLMKEWDIAHETRVSFEDNIQNNLTAQQQRIDSDVKETQTVEAKPLTISEKKPTLFPTCDAKPRSSWGNVSPEALVGRRVRVRLPCEDQFEDLVIREYNAEDGMHRVASAKSNAMWIDEMLSWMDLRLIPPEDIKWEHGEDPNFEAPGSSAGE